MLRPQARLTVRVVDPSGALLPAWVRLHPADDPGVVVREGQAPARWVVAPGTYRLAATRFDLTGATVLGDPFTLAAGEAVTRTFPVDVATLIVHPVNADRVRLTVYGADEPARALGTVEAGLPVVRLVPGAYAVRVEDTQAPGRAIWWERIALAAGERRLLVAQLPR